MAAVPPIDPVPSPSPLPLPTIDDINTGTVANDGTGDTVKDAFDKINTALGQILATFGSCAAQAWEIPAIQTVDYLASVGGYLIRMDTTSGDLDVTLPIAADVLGHVIEVSKWDSSANDVIVLPDSGAGDVLYGTTGILTSQYQVLRLRAVEDGWVAV